MAKSPIEFPIFKISATGNDFLLLDLMQSGLPSDFTNQKRGDLARELCDRHESLGADGLVIIEPDEKLDFRWDFYNSDGGGAEMCGNAARAVSLYINKKYGKQNLRFATKAGEVTGVIHAPNDIEVSLPPVKEEQWNQSEASLSFDFIRPGVPHAVVRVTQTLDRANLRDIAARVKQLPRFTAEGVNVTFVHARTPVSADSVTFERGVEDFTRACGTGAIAAAHSLIRGEEGRTVEIQVPGGRLIVIWKNGRPHLRGPAKVVAEMKLFKENV